VSSELGVRTGEGNEGGRNKVYTKDPEDAENTERAGEMQPAPVRGRRRGAETRRRRARSCGRNAPVTDGNVASLLPERTRELGRLVRAS